MSTKMGLFLDRNTLNKGVDEVSVGTWPRSNKCNYLL